MTAVRALLVCVVVLSITGGCTFSAPSPQQGLTVRPAPVVVQGAMGSEVDRLIAALERATETNVHGWSFWEGTIDGAPVVVSKTMKGMTNAAGATALALEHFRPRAIINQGTSGGHDPGLSVGDIVIGTTSVNIGAFKTGARPRGAGSDFSAWQPMDLLRSDGSAGQDPNAWVMHRFNADRGLLTAARAVTARYTRGTVVEGVIASSDVWNSEFDRIQRLHEAFGTSVEEMETAAAAQIAELSRVPFLGVRVLSNNITNGGTYNGATAVDCQQFVLDILRAYLQSAASSPTHQ